MPLSGTRRPFLALFLLGVLVLTSSCALKKDIGGGRSTGGAAPS